ncbi:Uncharacterised protein [Mycobacteroides abscessus subsp. abscessus]|nr:Uncharacterised protein [Mycobacteroides abscessus subsp. abscessus]
MPITRREVDAAATLRQNLYWVLSGILPIFPSSNVWLANRKNTPSVRPLRVKASSTGVRRG